MEPPIKRIKLSKSAKDQLIHLKRVTKIDKWNVLCRWAFCRSLADESFPATIVSSDQSNVEMDWHTFAGETGDILIIALKQRCHNDGLGTDAETLATQFRLHLHRGIGYLAAEIKSLSKLISLAL